MNIQYKVAYGASNDEEYPECSASANLERVVNEMLLGGWEPIGGVVMEPAPFYGLLQAMVKKAEPASYPRINTIDEPF